MKKKFLAVICVFCLLWAARAGSALAADLSALDAASAMAYAEILAEQMDEHSYWLTNSNSLEEHISFADILDMDNNGTQELIVVKYDNNHATANLGVWTMKNGAAVRTVDYNMTVGSGVCGLNLIYKGKETGLYYGSFNSRFGEGTETRTIIDANGVKQELSYTGNLFDDEKAIFNEMEKGWSDGEVILDGQGGTWFQADKNLSDLQSFVKALYSRMMAVQALPVDNYGPYMLALDNSYDDTFGIKLVKFEAVKAQTGTMELCIDRENWDYTAGNFDLDPFVHNPVQKEVILLCTRPGSNIRIVASNEWDDPLSILSAPFTFDGTKYHYFRCYSLGGALFSSGSFEAMVEEYENPDFFMLYGDPYVGNSTYLVTGADKSIKMSDKSAGSQSSVSNIKIILNEKALSFEQPPYMDNGVTMVPMRAIFEALGVDVDYDAASQKITAGRENVTIELTLGQKTAKKNGASLTLEAAAAAKNGSTMVPLRFVAEALQAQVDWDGLTQTITISQ